MATISGRKPLSQKPKKPTYNIQNFFRDRLALDPTIKTELDAKGVEGRWISYKKYLENGNYHEWGWQVYKRDASKTNESGQLLGNNPDGIIRRGDCVLAVRPKELCEQHRAYNADKAARQSSKKFQRLKAQELREMAEESGLGAQVHEGYELEDDEKEE
jgi:hypothetical protein